MALKKLIGFDHCSLPAACPPGSPAAHPPPGWLLSSRLLAGPPADVMLDLGFKFQIENIIGATLPLITELGGRGLRLLLRSRIGNRDHRNVHFSVKSPVYPNYLHLLHEWCLKHSAFWQGPFTFSLFVDAQRLVQ